MGAVYAIADLHLSLSGAKPMDVFGPTWTDHAQRMARHWDAVVQAEDTVLLPGDLSWALKLDEARPDLAWIGERPGRKILLRGNHDYWWTSRRKVEALLPSDCAVLQNNSHRIGAWVVVGARGWVEPDDPVARPDDAKIYARELERFRLSLADADRRFGRDLPRLAMLHYPPWIAGRKPSDFVGLMRAGGVCVCVYGHLHGADHALGVQGDRDGIVYHLVAADYLGFRPLRVLQDAESPSGGVPPRGAAP